MIDVLEVATSILWICCAAMMVALAAAVVNMHKLLNKLMVKVADSGVEEVISGHDADISEFASRLSRMEQRWVDDINKLATSVSEDNGLLQGQIDACLQESIDQKVATAKCNEYAKKRCTILGSELTQVRTTISKIEKLNMDLFDVMVASYYGSSGKRIRDKTRMHENDKVLLTMSKRIKAQEKEIAKLQNCVNDLKDEDATQVNAATSCNEHLRQQTEHEIEQQKEQLNEAECRKDLGAD